MKHIKNYRELIVGGQSVCTCGWESPIVDETTAFQLGRRQKSVDAHFREHLQAVEPLKTVENTMEVPAAEQAVGPAQRSFARQKRR